MITKMNRNLLMKNVLDMKWQKYKYFIYSEEAFMIELY